MQIQQLHNLTPAQISEVQSLMRELNPEIEVTEPMIRNTFAAPGTHFFAAVTEDGHIAGCASLCVYCSPTGRKASVEDVVVGQAARGEGLGRALVQHLIDFAKEELTPVDLHLTSRPERVAANGLYRSLGFRQRETNVYSLEIKKRL